MRGQLLKTWNIKGLYIFDLRLLNPADRGQNIMLMLAVPFVSGRLGRLVFFYSLTFGRGQELSTIEGQITTFVVFSQVCISDLANSRTNASKSSYKKNCIFSTTFVFTCWNICLNIFDTVYFQGQVFPAAPRPTDSEPCGCPDQDVLKSIIHDLTFFMWMWTSSYSYFFMPFYVFPCVSGVCCWIWDGSGACVGVFLSQDPIYGEDICYEPVCPPGYFRLRTACLLNTSLLYGVWRVWLHGLLCSLQKQTEVLCDLLWSTLLWTKERPWGEDVMYTAIPYTVIIQYSVYRDRERLKRQSFWQIYSDILQFKDLVSACLHFHVSQICIVNTFLRSCPGVASTNASCVSRETFVTDATPSKSSKLRWLVPPRPWAEHLSRSSNSQVKRRDIMWQIITCSLRDKGI